MCAGRMHDFGIVCLRVSVCVWAWVGVCVCVCVYALVRYVCVSVCTRACACVSSFPADVLCLVATLAQMFAAVGFIAGDFLPSPFQLQMFLNLMHIVRRCLPSRMCDDSAGFPRVSHPCRPQFLGKCLSLPSLPSTPLHQSPTPVP